MTMPPPDSGDRMSSCLFCFYEIALFDVPVAKPGDPVGLCKNRSSMLCGWRLASEGRGRNLHLVFASASRPVCCTRIQHRTRQICADQLASV
jgi:hypothetical protein